MFRTIPAMKMKPWVILKPFASDTWYTILALVVIIVFIMSFILKFERAEDYSCSVTALVAVAALSQQGTRDYNNTALKKKTYLFIISISIRFPLRHREIGWSNSFHPDHGVRFVGVQLLFSGDSVG